VVTGGRVRTLTTIRAHAGTQPAASLPRRSAAENGIRTTWTYVMLSTTEMHTTGLKTGAKSETASRKIGTMKGTMTTMVLTTISLSNTIP
jgi:hypothetical protein